MLCSAELRVQILIRYHRASGSVKDVLACMSLHS